MKMNVFMYPLYFTMHNVISMIDIILYASRSVCTQLLRANLLPAALTVDNLDQHIQ